VVDERAGEFDAVAVASSSDTGLEEMRARLAQPVTGMSESAMHFAVSLGPRFSLIDMQKTGAPIMRALVERYGHSEYLASIRLAIHLEGGVAPDQALLLEAILREGKAAVEEDGAQALIVGGSAAASMSDELSERIGVPVLDGITCAVRRAEQLLDVPK
jgi:allantoin racemase